jgi:hypothetical protein
MNEKKAVVKFNNSNLAVLCSYCHKILKTAKELTNDELFLVLGEDKNHLPAQYCEQCKEKQNGTTNNTSS